MYDFFILLLNEISDSFRNYESLSNHRDSATLSRLEGMFTLIKIGIMCDLLQLGLMVNEQTELNETELYVQLKGFFRKSCQYMTAIVKFKD